VREALARADNDFILPERPRSLRRKGASRLGAGLAGRVLASPGRAIAIVAGIGLMAAILVNALALQRGRHPAPLFGPTMADRNDKPARPDSAPPPMPVNPPARPAELAGAPPEPARPPAATAPARPAGRDPIGDMIRNGEAKSETKVEPKIESKLESKSESVRLIAAAQRALVKLGYGPLKTDGTLGIGTRIAIERFEKDKNLPVTGELAPRVARALSAAAAMPVE
jgi:hypothetical protein